MLCRSHSVTVFVPLCVLHPALVANPLSRRWRPSRPLPHLLSSMWVLWVVFQRTVGDGCLSTDFRVWTPVNLAYRPFTPNTDTLGYPVHSPVVVISSRRCPWSYFTRTRLSRPHRKRFVYVDQNGHRLGESFWTCALGRPPRANSALKTEPGGFDYEVVKVLRSWETYTR